MEVVTDNVLSIRNTYNASTTTTEKKLSFLCSMPTGHTVGVDWDLYALIERGLGSI